MPTFGERFGELVKRTRAVEGLSQQSLAVQVFGDESYKTRVSELENGKIKKPQAKTIDAYVVALNIPKQELDELLNDAPHPTYYDSLIDFFDVPSDRRLDIEIGIAEAGFAIFRYSFPMKVKIKRLEFFVEERTLLWVTEDQKRRPVGLPLTEDLSEKLQRFNEIKFVHHDLDTDERVDRGDYVLKVIN